MRVGKASLRDSKVVRGAAVAHAGPISEHFSVDVKIHLFTLS